MIEIDSLKVLTFDGQVCIPADLTMGKELVL
jgi:hypothetical protein